MSAAAFKQNIIANILQTQSVSFAPEVAGVTLEQFQALKGDDRGTTYRRLAPYQRARLADEIAKAKSVSYEHAMSYLSEQYGQVTR